MSGLGVESLMDKLVSHAMQLGVFETVNGHESKSAPGLGLRAEVWLAAIDPIQASGLAATSVRIAFNVRIRSDMLVEPQDDIDPRIANAADLLFSSLHGDFQLNDDAVDDVRAIDLLGMYGQPLAAKAGYLNQDNRQYRVIDVLVPIILNDVWSDSP